MSSRRVRHHEDLRVWREAITLARQLYQFVERLPAREQFGLAQQLRRAAVSIPANIAEGAARGSRREFLHFLSIAQGSLAEANTHLTLASELHGIDAGDELMRRVVAIHRMLIALRAALKKPRVTE